MTCVTEFIDTTTLATRLAEGALLLDVREAAEYDAGHVPAARSTPMSSIWQVVDSLPVEEDVYVICQSGHRSQRMADYLTARGIRAISVDGGTAAWQREGRPVVVGRQAS